MILLRLAWRNLWRNRRRTLLTTTTMALGLTVLLVTLGLGDGGHLQMINSAVRNGSGHVVFQASGFQELGGLERTLSGPQRQAVAAWVAGQAADFEMVGAAPRIWASVLASSSDGSVGVQLIAVQPEAEARISRFAEAVFEGAFLTSQDSGRVVLGAGVARKLKVGLGDKMVLMGQGAGGEIESIVARVKGLIRTGLEEFDQVLVLTDLATAQDFLKLGHRVHQFAVLLEDVDLAAPLAQAARQAFPDLAVLDWEQALPELADFIRIDDGGAYVFHFILFFLIAFMVFNTLLMSVLERGREFALLDAMGLVAGKRFLLVLLEASLIALLALLWGMALGLSLHAYLAVYGLPLDLLSMGDATIAGVAFDPIMYSSLSLARILQAIMVVFLMSFGLAMVAARRAALPGDIRLLGSH